MHTPALPREFAGEGGGGTGDGLVQVAYCHSDSVSHSWHASMMDMLVHDKAVGGNVIGSAPMRVFCSGPFGLIEGRNLAVAQFLDQTPHEWLFWVDTDMGFKPDSLDRLLAAADPAKRPVVSGLCFAAQRVGPDGYGGHVLKYQPTLFGLVQTPTGPAFVNKSRYKLDRMNRVAGTGSAFILIHRSVLETVRAKWGDEWYSPLTPPGGKPISEDLSFCWRVTDLLTPIFVHTGVKTTHHKEFWLGESAYGMPEEDPIFR
jgi:hypothetical protein